LLVVRGFEPRFIDYFVRYTKRLSNIMLRLCLTMMGFHPNINITLHLIPLFHTKVKLLCYLLLILLRLLYHDIEKLLLIKLVNLKTRRLLRLPFSSDFETPVWWFSRSKEGEFVIPFNIEGLVELSLSFGLYFVFVYEEARILHFYWILKIANFKFKCKWS